MNEKIQVPKGPDRVRLRPTLFFGSDGIDGAKNAFRALFNIFAIEAISGFCKRLEVRLYSDKSVSIHSFDRGLYIGDDSAWHSRFCELYSGSEYIVGVDNEHDHLYGEPTDTTAKFLPRSYDAFDLCSVQYASEFMNVQVSRDGFLRKLCFKKGHNIGGLVEEKTALPTGTYIHFKLDTEVFTDINIPLEYISQLLSQHAMLNAGLRCELVDDASGHKKEFFCENGVEEFVENIAPNATTPIFCNEAAVIAEEKGREYEARVKVTLCFARGASFIRCYHNFELLEFGGTHFDRIKDRICEAINAPELSFEEVQSHLVLVVESKCPRAESRYKNATKKSIANKSVTQAADECMSAVFVEYMKDNRNAIDAMFSF